MNIFRKILHHKSDNSDKVYVIDINKLPASNPKPYIVSVTWGKRDAPRLSSQIKGEFTHDFGATGLATKLINDKRNGKKGYKDAARDIVIPGLAPLGQVNIAMISASNREVPTHNVVIDIPDPSLSKRNIKV
jgi:predicted DNA-binding WGR domain protein